ncbi:hypothetical protein KSP39_PZI007641 [Platanthera zijinensis]|uniref:Uncharacterized protein n=1 Tax=Platanthera zijinensis TaxID=2320716 RepID=A0AAP0BQ47_9ASPA
MHVDNSKLEAAPKCDEDIVLSKGGKNCLEHDDAPKWDKEIILYDEKVCTSSMDGEIQLTTETLEFSGPYCYDAYDTDINQSLEPIECETVITPRIKRFLYLSSILFPNPLSLTELVKIDSSQVFQENMENSVQVNQQIIFLCEGIDAPP